MTTFRFDQIAENITVRVEPGDTDLTRYVGLEHLDPESLNLRRWGSPSDVIGQKLHFWKGDIIYGKRRAYQRKLVVADFEGICSAHAMVLRAKPDVCLPELLPFFMQSELFHRRALEISVGSLSPTINWSALARQEFPLPPLDEQCRIADLLWAADDAVEGKLNLMSSLLILMDSLREEIYFATNAIKIKIKEVAEIRYGLGQPPAKSDSGVPLVRATNISQGQISHKDLLLVNPDDLPASRAIYLQEGDIVLVRSGAYTGDSAMITGEWVNSIAGYDLVVSPDKSKIHPIFLAEFLLHKRTVRTILTPLSARSAQPHINAVQVGDIEVVLPSMDIQLKNAVKLIQLNHSVSDLGDNIELLKRTKKLLLEQSLVE